MAESVERKALVEIRVCEEHGKYESKGVMWLRGLKRVIWSGCPVCSECERLAEEAELKEREARQRQAGIEAKLSVAGVPARFRSKSFESFKADTEAMRHALNKAAEFAASFSSHRLAGTTLVLSGQPGTGKSHLALAILQTVLSNGGTGLYANVLDAIRMVRETWRRHSNHSEADILKTLGGVDLLVLDEIGVQYGTDAEQVTVFDILNRRYRDMLPTILLTNLDRAGLKTYLGERAFDRLRETSVWVSFDWESFRPKARL